MALRIDVCDDGHPVPKGYVGRSYKTRFLLHQERLEPEEGIELLGYEGSWRFQDIKLGFSMNVRLSETVDKGFVKVSATVTYEKGDDSRNKQVDEYIKRQLEQIAKDGMVKL